MVDGTLCFLHTQTTLRICQLSPHHANRQGQVAGMETWQTSQTEKCWSLCGFFGEEAVQRHRAFEEYGEARIALGNHHQEFKTWYFYNNVQNFWNLSRSSATHDPPRIYPMPFARQIVDLVEDHKREAQGLPHCPASGFPPALETLVSEGWFHESDLWQFVDFSQLYSYLRGNRNLKIPDQWKAVVPREL